VTPEAAPRVRPIIEVFSVSLGMVLFALFVHRGLPWIALSALGLLIVAATIGTSLRLLPRPAELLGLAGLPRQPILYFVVGGLIGAGGGMLHRHNLGLPVWPTGGVEAFAAVACLIGAAEELLYRGWLQGRAQILGRPAAIVIAAIAHASYKTALFAWPTTPMAIDYAGIALWTLIGGTLLGLLRANSENVAPSMFAHAVFDFMVYGALAYAPWWVWG